MAEKTHIETEGGTIPSRILFWGKTEPNTPAFIFWGTNGRFVLSRGDVLDLSSRFAYRLTQRGIKPGDVVCVSLQNSPERVVVDFGISLAGAIPMNAQILRTEGEDLVECLKLAQCKMLVVDPDIAGGAWNICKQHFDVHTDHEDFAEIICTSIPTLKMVEFCRTHKPEKQFLASLQKESTVMADIQKPTDTAYLFTTSGSSGYSKIVSHKHNTLTTKATINGEYLLTKGMEKYCNCAPLGWLGGFACNFLITGCPRVLFDDSNGGVSDRLNTLWKMITAEDVHTAILMPIQYMDIYAQEAIWKPSGFRLKRLLSTGQPIKRENLVVIGHLTDSIICAYGSTELVGIAGIIYHADNVDGFVENAGGFPSDGVEIRVVDANLQNVNPGIYGEILVRSEKLGDYVVEEKQNVLVDGWFRTDDVGYMHMDGFLVVEGRRSDAIMHGTYILYPHWLERELTTCHGVKQAVLVPVPDPVLHHDICVCVKPENEADFNAEIIINFCKAKMNVDVPSSMKFIPKYVIPIKEFPLTKTLKMDRKQLAETAMKNLNL